MACTARSWRNSRHVINWLVAWLSCVSGIAADPLVLHLRSRREVAPGSGRYHAVTQRVEWDATKTAIVVCDMWDAHTCPASARRVAAMAPRMNDLLTALRARGVLVIHAPSDTMAFYAGHPGRKLAQAAQAAKSVAPLERWCGLDPAREGPLPIDDSNGGCDGGTTWKKGDPFPWTRQIATLTIAEGDAITDSVEAYNLLRARGIEHLLVAGVHANMCVLGRPFAIRQMVRQGLDVALVRDLTDAMYDPAQRPFVNHHTGTDLVVEHIERHWCPTLRSGDLLDGREYRFPDDDRPTVVILMGEEEYETERTLPAFAREHLGKDYRVATVWLEEPGRTRFAGIEAVEDADILLVSVRRHPLPPEQMALLKAHVAAGKPVLGIRTASHPFHLRDKPPPAGLADWPDFDATVLGGSYTNHHSRDLVTTAWPLAEARDHPILAGIPAAAFPAPGGLYMTAPLAPGAVELLRGRAEGVAREEPVAWTFVRADGGRSFYTSLGHRDDFRRPEFMRLLTNACGWLAEGRRRHDAHDRR